MFLSLLPLFSLFSLLLASFVTLTYLLFSIYSRNISLHMLSTNNLRIYVRYIVSFSDEFVGPDRIVLIGNPWVIIQGKAYPIPFNPAFLARGIHFVSLGFYLSFSVILPSFSSFSFSLEDSQNFQVRLLS